jgi:23S rRNA pseudouridine2605 synthase
MVIMSAERLQKIIAAAGIASRRRAEELIASGRVSVNGQIVSELGSKADPERDHIRVDGKLLRGPERHVYLVLNKPKGYVTTVTDPEGRPTVMNLVRGVGARVYPVGRLDYLSEGLLLMTNDGALVERLMHASSKVPKTYWVKVSGTPPEEAIEKLRRGIVLTPAPRRTREQNSHPVSPPRSASGQAPPGATRVGQPQKRRGERAVKTAPAKIRLLKQAANPWYEVTLIEGRNRQIRRMFEQVGHHVEKIKRVRYGPLELDVESGRFRPLTVEEVGRLKAAVKQRAVR